MTKQQRLVLLVSILASFVGALDGFIVNVALPAISKDLGGGLVVQQWVVDAYLITLGSLILIAGSLSDLFGRRRILAWGLAGFGVTSLMCALAPNGTFLVVSRGLQGIAGALLVPSSLAMIISAFSGAAQSKAIGTWTAWFSVAAVAGPLLGGVFVSTIGWRWIFAINVLPIAYTLWVLRGLGVSERVQPGTKIDTPGAVLCALGLAGPVFALIEKTKYAWSDPIIWLPLAAGITICAIFIWWEGRNKQPMLPLSLFSHRNFSVGNVATTFVYAGLSMSTFVLIITLQQVGGLSALLAGMAMLPVTAIMFFLSARFGTLAGKYGPRFFMAAGPMVAAAGFLLMLRLQPQVHYITDLLPGVLVFGLGLAMTVSPLTSAVLGDVEPKHAGVASAVNNAVSRIAGLLAIAFIGVVTGAHITIEGYRNVLLVVAALLLAGGMVSAFGIQNTRRIKAVEN